MSTEVCDKNKSGLTFIWRIKNFHICPLRDDEFLESSKFTTELLDNTECILKLYPSFNRHTWIKFTYQEEPKQTGIQIELFFEKNDGTIVGKNFSRAQDIRKKCLYHCQKRVSLFEEADLFLPGDTLTIGCCIKKVSEKMFNAEKIIVNTEISSEKFSVNFPLTFQSSTSPVRQLLSVPLISASKKYPDFNIILTSPSYNHDVKSLTIQIKMTKSSFRVFSACKLSLKDADGNIKYLVEDESWFEADKDDENWELKNSIPEQKALFQSDKSILTLDCRLFLTDGTYATKVEGLVYLPIFEQLELQCLPSCLKKQSFKEKLKSLYIDGRLCDFTIHVDRKEFHVHKTVLGAVSPVFCAMLERDMTEKENSSLTIEDIDTDTMQRLIEFAYNESVDGFEWDSAVKLFSAADKYQISELKQICAEFMNSKLSSENVTDALAVADLHQDTYLKKAAEDFVYSHFNEVFKSEKWNEFMENYMKLANSVMCKICMKLSKTHLK